MGGASDWRSRASAWPRWSAPFRSRVRDTLPFLRVCRCTPACSRSPSRYRSPPACSSVSRPHCDSRAPGWQDGLRCRTRHLGRAPSSSPAPRAAGRRGRDLAGAAGGRGPDDEEHATAVERQSRLCDRPAHDRPGRAPGVRYTSPGRDHFSTDRLLPAIETLPGVRGVARSACCRSPVDPTPAPCASIVSAARRRSITVSVRTISPAYFQTLGIPLLSGRSSTSATRSAALKWSLINQKLAKEAFPAPRARSDKQVSFPMERRPARSRRHRGRREHRHAG